jgi:hypothetical protein
MVENFKGRHSSATGRERKRERERERERRSWRETREGGSEGRREGEREVALKNGRIKKRGKHLGAPRK